MGMTRPVFRFAPSPNGDLHLGHALSALLNAEAARRTQGRLLVRIEDLDRERCKPEIVTRQLHDLLWLGLRWETPVRRQSEHFGTYAAALETLRTRGLLYPCFASRGEIAATVAAHPEWPRDPDGAPLYPGLWREAGAKRVAAAMASGRPFAWRLDMATAADPDDPAQDWGDVVLGRKDVPASYHLAVVLDDAAQGVTHVVRGRDLERATEVHRVLQRLFGLPTPHYLHHRLILGPDGRKLSKSLGAASLREQRAAGATLDDVKRLIAWDPAADLAGLAGAVRPA
jgi:glutamyl-Q tRNA(Asp) synthetase